MRSAGSLAFVIFALLSAAAGCGKKGGGSTEGSGSAPSPSAAPVAVTDEELRALEVPALTAGARADNAPLGPLVVVTEKAIVVDGRSMVVIDGGNVDPAALVTDAKGKRIGPIATWADSWSKTPAAASSQAVLLAIEPTLPSALALQVISSFLPSEQRSFAFVVRTPDGPGTVPVRVAAPLPPPPAAPTDPQDTPVQLVVSLMRDRVVLWSMSGLEGTIADPKLSLTPATDAAWLTRLRDDLADIAKRRWDGRTRPDSEKTIVIMADASVASGDLVNAIASVRTDAKGASLFPDVQLSTGFDDVAALAAKKPDPPPPPPPPPPPGRDDVAVALQEEEVARFADMLAGEGSDSEAADLDRRVPGSDLGAQIAAVREGGSQVAVGGSAGRGTRGDGDPRVGVASKTPTGRILVQAKSSDGDTSLTPDDVVRKIQMAYMAGLKRCYTDQLKQDPTARGQLSLRFAVNETGRVVGARAEAPAAALGSCVEGLMASWRFNPPKDADGEATETAFRIEFGLVPE